MLNFCVSLVKVYVESAKYGVKGLNSYYAYPCDLLLCITHLSMGLFCSYGGERARLPGSPRRRDSFHIVLGLRNSSPLAGTESGHVSKMRHLPIFSDK